MNMDELPFPPIGKIKHILGNMLQGLEGYIVRYKSGKIPKEKYDEIIQSYKTKLLTTLSGFLENPEMQKHKQLIESLLENYNKIDWTNPDDIIQFGKSYHELVMKY